MGLFSGIGHAIGGLFGGGQSNGYNDWRNYMAKGEQELRLAAQKANQLLEPFRQSGQAQLPNYRNYLNTLGQQLKNNTWLSGYEKSPYAAFQQQEALKAANQAAAASGLLGSGANQEYNMKLAQQIGSADEANYFNQLSEEKNRYQNALAQLIGMGNNAAVQQGNWGMQAAGGIANNLQNQGAAKANEDMAQSSAINQLIGGLGGLFGGLF